MLHTPVTNLPVELQELIVSVSLEQIMEYPDDIANHLSVSRQGRPPPTPPDVLPIRHHMLPIHHERNRKRNEVFR